MADRDRERVGGVVRVRHLVEREDRLHHPPHLLLVGAAVAADRLLDTRRCVFGARETGGRRGDEHGSARLPDGERDAGVCADERFLQGDGIRGVQADQLLDALEDREQPSLQTLPRRRAPPPVADGPDAPAVDLNNPVPACSRPWIDAENSHDDTLGTEPDVSCPRQSASPTFARRPPEPWDRRPERRNGDAPTAAPSSAPAITSSGNAHRRRPGRTRSGRRARRTRARAGGATR